MTTERAERLARLLGGPDLQRVRERLRRRYERGAVGGTVVLSGLTEAERDALCGLLGRRSRTAGSLRFEIEELDAVLRRASLATSLQDALEVLDGPLADRTSLRADREREWRRVRSAASDRHLLVLLESPNGLGLLKRLSGSVPDRALALCVQAGRVLERLPATIITRSQLAADVLGDAHALDAGRAVATLVLAALRVQRPGDETAEQEDTDRSSWAAVGVLVNELARPALFLNLPAVGGMPGLGGEPAYLSLRALLRRQPAWQVQDRTVFVCENPGVVAIAADVLGERSAPLVCTDGMPAAAQRTLILQLKDAGAQLRYHGDFDWPGLAIGNVVMTQFEARPWRFCAHDYLDAVRGMPAYVYPLGESRRDALWDPALVEVMSSYDIAIHEESVMAGLLADLESDR
jgi:uncharacterized protein (TIGR02679 family)